MVNGLASADVLVARGANHLWPFGVVVPGVHDITWGLVAHVDAAQKRDRCAPWKSQSLALVCQVTVRV